VRFAAQNASYPPDSPELLAYLYRRAAGDARALPLGLSRAGRACWALEGVTVATDQFLGHRADPASNVVSAAAVPGFAALAAVALAGLPGPA
jgi:hypothetical protein